MHSADGATWTVAPGIDAAGGSVSGSSWIFHGLSEVAWNGTRFVAVGTKPDGDGVAGVILHSADGAAWTTAASGVEGTDSLSGVAWGGGRFVAVGYRPDADGDGVAGVILHSADGASWTAASGAEGTDRLAAVAWGGGRFVAAGFAGDDEDERPGRRILHSADGASWTAASSMKGTNRLAAVAWGGGRFVAVGGGEPAPPAEPPGGTGSEPAPPPGAVFQAVEAETTELRDVILHSTDGATWTAAPPIRAAWERGTVQILGVTYDGTRFVAVGSIGGSITGQGLVLISRP